MAFLGGYGIYVTVATDKLVGRMLDNLAAKHKVQGHLLVGPYNAQVFARAQKYCRVGFIANTIGRAIHDFLDRRCAVRHWSTTALWKSFLLANSWISAQSCASLYRVAVLDRNRDWSTECRLFCVEFANSVSEEWDLSAWENPLATNIDFRAMHLDSPCFIMDNEFALFGDGGYDVFNGAYFSAEIRFFQSGPQYFVSSLTSVPPVSSRLPCRFGFEESIVHTAELSAMIASLRWCTPGAWNMFVGDRSSLFAALREAADPAALWPSRGACLPLEGRLRAILRRIANSWSGDSSTPLWRDDQELHPEKWDVRIPLEAEGETQVDVQNLV